MSIIKALFLITGACAWALVLLLVIAAITIVVVNRRYNRDLPAFREQK